MHGYLLQIRMLLKTMSSSSRQTQDFVKLFVDLLSLNLLDPDRPNHVIGRVFIDILSELLMK